MKQNKFIVYTCIAFLFLLVGACKTSKKGTSDSGIPKVQTEYFTNLQQNAFRFNTLTAKLNVDLNLPGQNLSSRVDLKMIKDEAFQLSVQPFLGIEIFRAVISVDSIKVLDRMNKRYVAESLSKLKGQTPVEFNFYNLQALFTNQVFYPGEQAITPNLYSRFALQQEDGNAELSAKDALGLIYLFSSDREQKLINTSIAHNSEQYAIQWNYANFRLTGEQSFPMTMDLQLLGNEQAQGGIKFNFSKLELNKPVTLDGSIPEKYKRITFAEIIKLIAPTKK